MTVKKLHFLNAPSSVCNYGKRFYLPKACFWVTTSDSIAGLLSFGEHYHYNYNNHQLRDTTPRKTMRAPATLTCTTLKYLVMLVKIKSS